MFQVPDRWQARKRVAQITRVLVDEHRIIEQVLNCLERMAEHSESHRKLEEPSARDAIAFLRSFIETCHDTHVHTRLMPALHATGVHGGHNPGCLLQQSREQARIHLDAMDAVIERACAGSADALDRFAEHARAYINVLLDCIARQEDYLFPLLEKTTPAVDELPAESGSRECKADTFCIRCVELANDLAERFGVPRVIVAPSGDGAESDETPGTEARRGW